MSKMNFGKYYFNVSREDKILFPEDKITKKDFIDYYKNIADVMIPHIKDRPVSMLRLPDGIKGEIFFQKKASGYFPDWIQIKKIKKKGGGTVKHVICNNKATLAYLASQEVVTPHVWLSRIDKINHPDRIIFDLDPPDKKGNFDKVKKAAEIIKNFFNKELDIKTYFMLTGSKGIHVVIPVKRNKKFSFVRRFARDAAKVLASRYPEELTDEVRKKKRKGRIFLDTARNAYAQIAVPPYSVRPINGAPIAVPVKWKELSAKNITAQSFNIKNIFDRLEKASDPWKDINQNKTSLKQARKKLDKIIKKEFK